MSIAIYLDMDGVLADLDKGYKDKWHYTPGPADGPHDPVFWPNIMGDGTFFANLPLMEDAELLVNTCLWQRKQGNVEEVNILTACSATWFDTVKPQKIEWLNKHFPNTFDNIYTTKNGKDKAKYARSRHDLLIDDTKANVKGFRKAGGQAILYRNFHDMQADFTRALR